MPGSATITREQLRTVLIATELGGKTGDSYHFSYAKLGNSSYAFGQMQFDVDASRDARAFLKENGFDDNDIKDLRSHGGLSHNRLDALDAKLQAIPEAIINQFTNDQLDKKIAEVDGAIDQVRAQNPANADAIAQDQELQLGLADYANQFGSITPQLLEVMKGNAETLRATGITVQAGDPPRREDIQTFIGATKYGNDRTNARGIAGREAHFNAAMAELGLGSAIQTQGQVVSKTGAALREGAHSSAVQDVQAKLSDLGYTDSKGQLLQADGVFGRDTRNAVVSFQSDHGLTADGKVGAHTRLALDVAVKAHAPSRQTSEVLPETEISLGCPYLDCLYAAVNSPAAFDQALRNLGSSPYGDAFRAEGRAVSMELQNQQLQQQLIQQQGCQAQRSVRQGPVM